MKPEVLLDQRCLRFRDISRCSPTAPHFWSHDLEMFQAGRGGPTAPCVQTHISKASQKKLSALLR